MTMHLRLLSVTTFCALCSAPAVAHVLDDAVSPIDSRVGSILALAGLVVTALMYAAGSRRGNPRVVRSRAQARARACWWTGWSTLVLAMFSPIDGWGAELFSMHMVQHELLMIVAAPLVVLGRPVAVFARAMPGSWTRAAARLFGSNPWARGWRWLTLPATAWSLHAVVLWGWHAPVLFDASLRSNSIHDLQHLAFVGSALLFWWAVLRRRTQATSVAYVFTTMLHTGVLGMLLTFSTSPWYPFYAHTTPAWGLSPLEDQQLGGLIMWIPSGALLIGAGLALVYKLLNHPAHPARGTRAFPQEIADP